MKLFSTTKLSRCLIAVIALAVVAPAAFAQDVTTGSATATVLTILTVTATQALDFGNVYQGVAKSQDETSDAQSGIFTITGEASANIACYLQLPDYVALANGTDRMPIVFSATDAAFAVLAAATPATPGAGATADMNPRNLTPTAIGAAGTSKIFLGGTVVPTINQSAGAYSADIILTVAYMGS